jgi:hypothetical protein
VFSFFLLSHQSPLRKILGDSNHEISLLEQASRQIEVGRTHWLEVSAQRRQSNAR